MADSESREPYSESIDARLGVIWIGRSHVEQFLRETLQDDSIAVTHSVDTGWSVHGGRRGGNMATATWGTPQMCAEDIAQLLLQQRPIRVGDDRFGLDGPATAAAQQKANELNVRFSEWAWEDPERGAELARQYNELFNIEPTPHSYEGVEISMSTVVPLSKPDPQMIEAAKAALTAAHAFPGRPTSRRNSSQQELGAPPPGVARPADRGVER
ncbi:hypothetical protein [Actinomadura sp. NPDC048394]|uniref:hypothetical protein n=1 Tax=Actinomadura sp. NPDC048394 TaxID=3158223 RepID=UPI0033D2D58C